MLIAASAVAIAVASSAAAGAVAPVNHPLPPIVINVSGAPRVSSALMTLILAEADALFRAAGVSFIWRHDAAALATLRVTIGDESGAPRDEGTPLGWIVFEAGQPGPEIYLSLANAERFMADSRDVIGLITNMPVAQRELMLARVLGRALAHELGHYLLSTREHTAHGLLKAVRSAQDFFAPDSRSFQLEPIQRTQIAARLNEEAVIAGLQPSGDGVRARRRSQ